MSAAEVLPELGDPIQVRRDALQAYLGDNVIVAAEARITPIIRQWEVGCDKDRQVTSQEFHVAFNSVAGDQQLRHNLFVANPANAFSAQRLHNFSTETGISWTDAEVWTVDACHLSDI